MEKEFIYKALSWIVIAICIQAVGFNLYRYSIGDHTFIYSLVYGLIQISLTSLFVKRIYKKE